MEVLIKIVQINSYKCRNIKIQAVRLSLEHVTSWNISTVLRQRSCNKCLMLKVLLTAS